MRNCPPSTTFSKIQIDGVEQQDHIDLRLGRALERGLQTVDFKIIKPLREREIFLQQPIPLERPRPIRKQRLVILKPDRLHRRRRQMISRHFGGFWIGCTTAAIV